MEERQSGISEAMDAGTAPIQAKQARAAASALIKGAAGGNVAGALAMAAIQNRHGIAKAAIAITALLLLPVMFLAMLPGLVFGSLTENTGALNDSAMMSENLRAASQTIVDILKEAHGDTVSTVDAEISNLPEGDTAVISDPYAYSISVNAYLLISQYCASKDNWEEINIADLEDTIRQHKAELFSYAETTQTVTIEVEIDPDMEADGEDGTVTDETEADETEAEQAEAGEIRTETVTVTQHTFTVSYVGDAYFADNVFKLTDKQKELAASYSENLALFFGQAISGIATADVSSEVLSYRPTVEGIAARYGMAQYVDLILAVMMQESGGKGLDVMQASESGFNTKYPRTKNGITDSEYSIECGIQALKNALEKAGCTGPTDLDRIRLALQGYNYGSGYIDWAMERDGGYTKENAIAYSDMMCARPNWPYSNYGDKEYVDHVFRYYTVTAAGGTYPPNGMQIPHYLQGDYANIPYGSGSIASSGCAPTCFSMVASYLTGTVITPADAVVWCGNAYYKAGEGTYWSYFGAAAAHFGCGAVTQTADPNAVLAALSEGKPVISSQSKGLFTDYGHFIVLRGITADGKVLVNDPNDSEAKNYISREFDMMTEIHATAKAYWIFEGMPDKE